MTIRSRAEKRARVTYCRFACAGRQAESKAEIRVATVFRNAPEPFLRMIVVHELAHLKEKEHNKAFYQLCCHMEPQYHQLEFDTRLWLTQLSLGQDKI